MSFRISRRAIVILLIAAGVAAASITVVSLWPSEPDCATQLDRYVNNGEELSTSCAEPLNRGVQEVENQASSVSACHDAIESVHAEAWTVPLKFDSTEITEASMNEYDVFGESHFVTGNGDRINLRYTCTVAVDGGATDVLTASLS